jgi:hypothetical protein
MLGVTSSLILGALFGSIRDPCDGVFGSANTLFFVGHGMAEILSSETESITCVQARSSAQCISQALCYTYSSLLWHGNAVTTIVV